ncbi:MAG: Tad domain-containing protein, partial [Dehalococcoidia bacterium]|nr:Tad domain-containing protein [Dehalococcoidia bacterium]
MRRLFQEQRGSVLIYVTLSMVVLLAFSAGVADMGMLYENRRQLQNGVDGAALAGAQELLRFDLLAAERRLPAENTALYYAQLNGIEPEYPIVCGVDFDGCPPYVHIPDDTNAVVVVARRNLNLMVAGLLNSDAGGVVAFATAIVAPMSPTEGLWPWGVSNCSDWDEDPLTPVTCGVPEGQRIVLMMSAPPNSPGNFQALDYPYSSGAKDYGDSIKYGYGNEPGDVINPKEPWCGKGAAPGCTGVDDPYVQTEGGKMAGPTESAVDYLVDMASSSGQDDPASGWNEPVDQCTWPDAPKTPSDPDVPPPA